MIIIKAEGGNEHNRSTETVCVTIEARSVHVSRAAAFHLYIGWVREVPFNPLYVCWKPLASVTHLTYVMYRPIVLSV
jgi:hypothetical protein